MPLGFNEFFICCAADNDLLLALQRGGTRVRRCASAREAVDGAPEGGAVLVLADGYPERTTALPSAVLRKAIRKRQRLYVEFARTIGPLRGGNVRTTQWERTVVASPWFGRDLLPRRIVQIHDCHFVPMRARRSHLAVARVAGFDTAVFGLPSRDVFPILFEHPAGGILVATTALSRFVTARYAPSEAWRTIWERILAWLCGDCRSASAMRWTPAVQPSYGPKARLPADAEGLALRRGVAWFENSRLFIHRSWLRRFAEADRYGDRVGPAPSPAWPCGDGRLGMLEGVSSAIACEGSQRVRWYRRNDCMGEGAMAMAFGGEVAGCVRWRRVARHLTEHIYRASPLTRGPRADPRHPAYGLVGWSDPNAPGVYYGDDNARSLMGTMAAAAVLKTRQWDRRVLLCLLANLRTSDRLGFRPNSLRDGELEMNGWRRYANDARPNYAPHYESYLWACFLWAYRHTGYEPFLAKAETAIRMTMAVYPDHWLWANGMQQERARMLLPLAWLVRVRDTREHRRWLKQVAGDLLARQDRCGPSRRKSGRAARADMRRRGATGRMGRTRRR